jgi:hypothetical protein
MNEGFMGRTYLIKVVEPTICVYCRGPIAHGAAFALSAPYYCMLHSDCAHMFSFDGRWPHAMPAAFYDQVPTTFQQRPLRTSQDDSVVAYSAHSLNNQRQ